MEAKKGTGRIIWIGGLIISFSLGLGIPIEGHADLKDILLRFQPYITAQEEYSDNIDLTPHNKKSDFITTIYPGIRFSTLPRSETTRELRRPTETGGERFGLDLDYRLGLVFYGKETDNNYIGQNGTLNAWYTVAQKLTFRVSEYLIRSEEPREPEYPGVTPPYISGNFVDLYLQGTQRQRFIYLRNVVTPSVEYALGRDSLVSLSYRNNIYQSQNPSAQDSQENFINPRLTYWFNIRHGIMLDYGLTFGNFQRSPDLTGNAIRGRYTYRFNPRTSLFGEYAFYLRHFESPGVNYNIQAPSLGIEHAFSPTLSASVQLGYFWQSPEKGSGENGPTYNVVLTQRGQRITYALLLQGGYREDFFTTDNQGFTLYHRAVGSIRYQIAERVATTLSGSYERTKSGISQSGSLLGVRQIENLWGANGSVSYQMLRWLNGMFSLSYRVDDSNISTRDYAEFRGLFQLTATY
jgi:hypothetical protein